MRARLNILKILVVSLLFATSYKQVSGQDSPIDFDFLLVASAADPGLEMWRRTLRGTALNIPAANHLYKGQHFSLVVIFQGFDKNADGQAEVKYEFKVYNPEKELILENSGLNGILGKVPSNGGMALARQQIALAFEPEDDFGKYRIEVIARDMISGKIKKRTIEVELVPLGYARSLESLEAFRRWLPTYYLQPDPGRALLAYLDYSELENLVNGQLNFSQIAFFQNIFQENPYLLDTLAAAYPDGDETTRYRVLFMMALLDYRQAAFLRDLPEREKAFFETVRMLYPPDAYNDLALSQQIDMLWAEFYATGRYAPIEQIIRGLSLSPYDGSLAKAGKQQNTELSEDERQNAYRDMLLQSVRWSLVSNCRQHPLVRAYCLYMLQEGELPETIHEELGLAIATADSAPSRVGFQKGIPEKPIPNPFKFTPPPIPSK